MGTCLSQHTVWCGGTLSQAPQGVAHRLAWPQPCLLLSLWPAKGLVQGQPPTSWEPC